ncbi:MAG: hypothetical protein C5B49_14195 [Bdellovibrio sp.]|nr:MAG: hypothetical protein C5B49_14195 [Bdellovibrio sp.]
MIAKIVLLPILSLAGLASQPDKIGYIDLQKAVPATTAGKKAKEVMDAEFKKRKESLDKKKADIEKMGQDLEKKKSVLSEEVLNRKNMELNDEMMKFQKVVNDNQVELQKKEKEVLEPIFEKMKKVIEKVANEKGFTFVIEKQAQNVLFARKENDLTDDIVKAFEKEK